MNRFILFFIAVMISWISFGQGLHIGIVANQGSAPAFDSDYQAVLDFAGVQGYTLPSAQVQEYQNQLVLDYKTNGIWAEDDVIYVPAQDGSEEFGTINWKDPNNYQLLKIGTVDWTSNYGFKGDGTTGAMNTQYHPEGLVGAKMQNFDNSSVTMYLHNEHPYNDEGNTTGVFYSNGQYSSGKRTAWFQSGSSAMSIANFSTTHQTNSLGDNFYAGLVHNIYDDTQTNATTQYRSQGIEYDASGNAAIQDVWNHLSYGFFIGASNYNGGLGANWTSAGWGYWSGGSKQTDKAEIKRDLINNYFDDIIQPTEIYEMEDGVARGYQKDMNESNLQDIFWKSDGLMYWIIGATGDEVDQYVVTDAWRIEGSTVDFTLSVAGQENVPTGLWWHPSGDWFYICGLGGDDITRYDTVTSWDIDGATYTNDSGTIGSGLYEIEFEPDGLSVWGTESQSYWYIRKFELTTAWDVTTLNVNHVAQREFGQTRKPSNFGYNSDGTYGFVALEQNGEIATYRFPIPYDWVYAISDETLQSVYTANLRAAAMHPNNMEIFWLAGAGSNVEMKEHAFVGNLDLGPVLNSNPGFDTDTGWSKSTGWTISGGKARYDGTGGTSNLYQSNTASIVGREYIVSVTVDENTGTGTNQINFAGEIVNIIHLPEENVWRYRIKSTSASAVFQIYGRASEPFVIDDFTIQIIN